MFNKENLQYFQPSKFQGGSWVSTGDEASKFARFAFRRHFIQHAGFRIARSLQLADKINVPARMVKDEVFVLGVGVEGKKFYSFLSMTLCPLFCQQHSHVGPIKK